MFFAGEANLSGIHIYGQTTALSISADGRGQISGIAPCCHTRRPGPLEVMSPKVPRHIHHLANKVQVGPVQDRHGFGR